MEWKIGEIRQVDNEWYQCIRDITCINCGFNNKGCLANKHITGDCSGRLDGASVVFKKLEKVGEPYIFSNMSIHNITMQQYKVFIKPIFTDNSIITTYNMVNETISIEIKNKENMKENEENKYDGKMDKECIPLCDALNSLPDVETTESCCGHCKDRFRIFFKCKNPYSLSVISRVFNRRYSGTKLQWIIEVETHDNGDYNYFVHSVEAYENNTMMEKDISQLVENIKHWSSEKYKEHFINGVTSKEEKKLNLKSFNLEAAKSGKPVCTRDGRKARVLCYDFKQNEEYPILVAVENKDGKECALLYSNDGISEMYKSSNNELMMFPEKKEGWMNVYNSLGVITFSHNPFDTKEEALASEMEFPNKNYVDTVKVEWEE